jgi:hypothetical protein
MLYSLLQIRVKSGNNFIKINKQIDKRGFIHQTDFSVRYLVVKQLKFKRTFMTFRSCPILNKTQV